MDLFYGRTPQERNAEKLRIARLSINLGDSDIMTLEDPEDRAKVAIYRSDKYLAQDRLSEFYQLKDEKRQKKLRKLSRRQITRKLSDRFIDPIKKRFTDPIKSWCSDLRSLCRLYKTPDWVYMALVVFGLFIGAAIVITSPITVPLLIAMIIYWIA